MSKSKVATIYIDGFNLYYGMLDKGWSKYKWLDLCSFARSITPEGYDLGQVWYFTSRIKGDVAKHERQQRYITALRVQNGKALEIRFGNYQTFDTHCKHCKAEPVICDSCKNEYVKPNEKKTDVNLATAMLTDCIEQLTDCVVIVSGDSDYESTLVQIGRLFPSVYKVAAYPPKRRNNRLGEFCDHSFDIEESCFVNSQLPNPVKSKRTGKKYPKPDLWK